jgi:NAD(P)-dependent dehydrogenase (short-subunit alcohol dehydrogenase family)
MKKLEGKIVLITGGTSGIGAAAAALFRDEGAIIVATGSSAASVEAAQAQMPNIEFIVSDAGDPAAAKALIEHIRVNHGRLDVVFANAGTNRLAPIEEVDEAIFDRLLGVTLRGPFFLLKHAVSLMSDGGSIILTSSTAALRGMATTSVYGAGKAALRALGLHLAVELAPRKIRVNTVTPGPVATPFGQKLGLTEEQIAGFGAMIGRVPLGRMGGAGEVAAAALYFASDASGFTTGAELVVDGGLTIT